MSTHTPRNWHSDHLSTLSRGERAADYMRNGMGSWLFVGSFLALMALWAVLNTLDLKWDPYPLTSLTYSSACLRDYKAPSC